ncbi:MAG: flippase-like domain-containing protein [Clostridioides sp.]|jgi:uncharacterized protein (TIRG00374 family)|nr:flippase-like domain-containing protein [Clostridioides sp.]
MKNKKYIFSIAFMIVAMILTGYYVFSQESLNSLIDILLQVKIGYVLIGFSMMFIYLGCEAMGIKTVMKSLGKKVPFLESYGYSFVGFYFSAITPSASGGQPAQVYYMTKDKLNISYSSLTLLILSIFHQAVALVYAIIMVVSRYSFLKSDLVGMKILLVYGVVSNVILIGAMVGAMFSKKVLGNVIKGTVKLLSKIKIVKNLDKTMQTVDRQIAEYQKGAEHIKQNPTLILKVLFLTIVQITALFLVPFFVYKAFNLTGYKLIDLVAMQAILTLAVSSLPLPGSVGASETGFMTMFKVFFSGGLLIPAMLVSRLLNFYAFLVVSAVITFVIHIRQARRDLKDDKPDHLEQHNIESGKKFGEKYALGEKHKIARLNPNGKIVGDANNSLQR